MISHPFLHGDFFDVLIYQYGYEKCEPRHNWGPALRSHYLFHYVISGNGTLRIQTNNQDKEYHIHGGQAFLIVPNKLIHYFADNSDPWEYIGIELDGLKAKNISDKRVYLRINLFIMQNLKNCVIKCSVLHYHNRFYAPCHFVSFRRYPGTSMFCGQWAVHWPQPMQVFGFARSPSPFPMPPYPWSVTTHYKGSSSREY